MTYALGIRIFVGAQGMSSMEQYTVWIGTKKGLLKGIDVPRSKFTNCGSIEGLDPQKEIRALRWNSVRETELLIGQRCGTVKRYHLAKQTFDDVSDVSAMVGGKEDGLAGLVWLEEDSLLLTCTTSGRLLIENLQEGETVGDMHVGNHVACFCQNSTNPHQIAVGGHENDLKVYDISRLASDCKPIFQAKNVRNDFVDLRVPVSVTAAAFLPNSGDQPTLVIGTAHRHVRLYDTRVQRRPVVSITHGETSITALDVVSSGEVVVVGNAHGTMSKMDLKKSLACIGGYKGAAGSITDIKCSGQHVTSCGLDRYFRLHHIDNQKLLKKVYVKQQASCILLSNNLDQSVSSESQVCSMDGDQEFDAIWQDMAVVTEPTSKKPKLSSKKTKRQT